MEGFGNLGEIIAPFAPSAPEGANNLNINYAYLDEKAIKYAVDRIMGGLYVRELTF